EQRRLYGLAQQQVLHNMALIKPGLGYREFAERCWPVPEDYIDNRYIMMVHGCGLVDEYPGLVYARQFPGWAYGVALQENMVVSVESYSGKAGGKEGVKLEQQVLVTSSGAVALSTTPFEDALVV